MKNRSEHVTRIATSPMNPLQFSVTCFVLIAATVLMPARRIHAQPGARPPEPRMQQVHEAVNLAQHGDPDKAMQIASQLLKQDPKFVPAMKLKAMLLEGAGQGAEAGEEYQEALKLAPNDGDLLLKTGIYNLATGRKEEALALLLHASRVHPAEGEIQYYLAQAYHLNGHDELALAAIRKSLKADPASAAIMQKYGELLCSSGNNKDGLHWLIQARKANPRLSHIDYEIGAANYKSMDLSNAAENLKRAAEVDPDDLNALQLLASTQTRLAQWEAAKQSYASLLARRPGEAESLLRLGQCELELKDYSNAVGNLQAALHADPTKLLAHFYLSRAYAAIGKPAEAQHEAALHHLMMEQMSFVRTVETDQREDQIRLRARQMLQDRDENAALKLYQETFRGTAATSADAFVFIGKTYLFLGNTEDGLRCIHHALSLDPKVRGAHTYLGILDLKLSDLAKAEDEFKAELANDSSYQLAIAEIGEVRYHQEKWAEAADWLFKSKSMTPEFLYMLSDAKFHLGNVADARLVAETAAAYGASDREFMRGLVTLLLRNGQTDLAQRIAKDAHL